MKTVMKTGKRVHWADPLLLPSKCTRVEYEQEYYKKYTDTVVEALTKLKEVGSPKNKCDRCHKVFEHPSFLVNHARYCSSILDWSGDECVCSICFEPLSSRGRQTAHFDQVHFHVNNRFQCYYCNEEFGDREKFLEHSEHHWDGIFSCNVCGREFRSQGGFVKHVKTSVGHISTPPRSRGQWDCATSLVSLRRGQC